MEPEPAATSPNPLVGAWRLVSFEIRAADGETTRPFGDAPIGSLIYAASGHFAAQAMRSDRPPCSSGDQLKSTPEEMAANYRGVVSYYGEYTVEPEEAVVIHHVEGSLFPNWQGGDQRRFYAISGNRLTLTTPPTAWGGGGEVVAALEWVRVP